MGVLSEEGGADEAETRPDREAEAIGADRLHAGRGGVGAHVAAGTGRAHPGRSGPARAPEQPQRGGGGAAVLRPPCVLTVRRGIMKRTQAWHRAERDP